MKLVKYNEIDRTKDIPKEYRAIKRFVIDDLANLTINILNKYSDENKLEAANKVNDLVMFMLETKGLIKEGVQQSFVDILIASSLLYNIIEINEENWNEVYSIRNIVMETSKEEEYRSIPSTALEMLCDTIEGQLGEKMPIKGSRPNPNTPGELFSLAVAIASRYIK